VKDRKYILAVFGDCFEDLRHDISYILPAGNLVMDRSRLLIYEDQRYDTGLPREPVEEDGILLHFHGIVFPARCSLDYFYNNRVEVLRGIIRDTRRNLARIPYELSNGSYIGLAVDVLRGESYMFTSFLNSIPLYYYCSDKYIAISSDLELLAKVLNLTYTLTDGLLEYYANGTNLSDFTAFPQIRSLPKGAYARFSDKGLDTSFYYTMPKEDKQTGFEYFLSSFSDLWARNVGQVHSGILKYGLGFTGGIDSRIILAAIPDRSIPLLYTGSHPDHPDVLLARKICHSLGLTNHRMEDYRHADKLSGYARYCSMSDNPYHCNSLYFYDQMLFRKANGIVYEFSGLTEFLGGVYHYQDRRSISNAFKMNLPPRKTALRLDTDTKLRLISLGLRNHNVAADLRDFGRESYDRLVALQLDTFDSCFKQLGEVTTEEMFLERFRHTHKMANLLSWAVLPGRRFNEHLSPSMNIEMTDFACSIPLQHRDSRKLLLAYLKRYHPELAKHVITGYIFSPRSPWIIYKLLSPHLKVLNQLGYRIPYLQWYIKPHKYRTIISNDAIYRFQECVCRDSDIISGTRLLGFLNKYSNDRTRLMRLFNIALMEKKMSMTEEQVLDYLLGKLAVVNL